MSEREHIIGRVNQVRRAAGLGHGIRAGAIGLGLVAVLVWSGGSLIWLLLAGAVAVVGFVLGRPSAPEAARQLDLGAGSDGAIECAYDHRDSLDAYAIAQRAQAVVRLSAAEPVRAVRRPSMFWAAPVALWIGPLMLIKTPVEAPIMAEFEASAGAESPGLTPKAQPAAEPKSGEAQAKANDEAIPDAGVAGDGGTGAGAATSLAEVGGVGAQAGDRTGASTGRGSAERRAGIGPDITLGRGTGDTLPGVRRVAVAPPGPIPPEMDDVADPARPYPRRYHPVVAQWFERRR